MTTTGQTKPKSGPGMPPAYNPADHETRIRERWDASRAFHADPKRVLEVDKPPYCILIPPPNVTGALHLGHALNNTLQDILVRIHRMKGFEALWMPGTDHAGIATQTVVDKRLQAEGEPSLKDYKKMEAEGKPARDAFIAKVQVWKDEYEERITNQLKLMGCSCDWERQRFTMDEFCARAVREAFFQLFKAGLIYRGKRLVNWDPVTQTALADDEVEMKEVEGKFYYLRYPLCDESGAPAKAKFPDGEVDHVTVATTRPETYLGDTAVAVNPTDPRAKSLKGKFVKLPLVGRVIPIVEDDYVVLPNPEGDDPKAKYATGFLKVTPAHDENDYQLGQRHGLDIINVMAPDASISDQHGWSDVGEAKMFVGMPREEARKAVVAEFEQRGLLAEIRAPYFHSVGHSYRSHAMIEPYLSDQWYVKVTDDRMAGSAQRAVVQEQQSGNKWLKQEEGRSGVAQLSELCAERPNSHEWSALLDAQSFPAIHPEGFVGRDPFPPGEPAPADLMGSIRNLPHLEMREATYFVTWRTRDDRTLSKSDREQVLEALRHFDGDQCVLYAATVLNNHVHCLVKPIGGATLSRCVESVKKFSAREVNQANGREGSLWQDERFDHVVRHEGWFARLLRYIVMNPVEAKQAESPERYHATFVHDSVWKAIGRTRSASDMRRTNAQLGELCHPGGASSPSDADYSMTFHPSRYAKTYEAWHENIRDWCISRQLWWGHRIPVWSSVFTTEAIRKFDELWNQIDVIPSAFLSVSNEPVRLADGGTGSTYYICLQSDDPRLVDEIERAGFQRDPDVLDTWFSSALWPLSTMGWPDSSQDAQFDGLLDAFKPTSVLCTARDIITLWVSRMVMFNRFFADGQIPFHDVYIHPVIQDGDGKRMSKSAGNGVDPLDIIHSHGADAMRFTLCQLASQTQDVRMPVERDESTGRNTSPKFDLGKRFCNKLWNASRFTLMMLSESDAGPEQTGETPVPPLSPDSFSLVDRWMLSRLAFAESRITHALESYEFNVYADVMYDLLWTEFCDWYLESVKPTVKQSPAQQSVLRAALNCILRMLHPIAPFVTETIFDELKKSPERALPDGISLSGEGGRDARPTDSGLLCLAAWPRIDRSLRDDAVESEFEQLQELIRTIRDVRSQQQTPPKKRVTLHTTKAVAALIENAGGVVETLAGLESVVTTAPDSVSTTFTFGAEEHRLSGMTDVADSGAEKERLSKSLAELEGSIVALEKRLSNPGYVDKAPAKLVQETRDQLAAKQSERDAIKATLEGLG